MKVRIFSILIFLTCCFASCKKETSLQEFITDSWQTTYLKIDMITAHKTDSLQVYEDKFDNNPQFIAQSIYNKDGTFSAWFLTKENKKVSESIGTWSVLKDSLFVKFNYGGRDMKVGYHITKTKDGFVGKSKYDWDEDGDFDDILTMKTKRLNTK
ncbi:hypothetical protein [uncultured Polaribacter sp.]|uniref:hypothetical protein n=1 Tax=uncultured Polaribacter sp. TaxID=174711 RepID=UPI00262A3E07|nr:hypothetical protein [uncultured Polaribacter sp.]